MIFTVNINGKNINADGMTILDYLSKNNYDAKRIAIEKNGSIIPKSQYEITVMNDGDIIEIVSFVGGG